MTSIPCTSHSSLGLIARTPCFKSKTPQIVGVSLDKSGEIYLEICHPAVHPVIGDEGQFEVGRLMQGRGSSQ